MMIKRPKKTEQIPSLFPPNWDQPQSPNFDANFFKNFVVTINGVNGQPEHYYFKPWNESQKRSIVSAVNNLKEMIIDYQNQRKAKISQHILFPHKELKAQARSVLKHFFQPSNLILDEKFDDRLQRYQNIEQQHQSNIENRKKNYGDIMANIPKNNTTFWTTYEHLFETFNQPNDEAKLKKRAENDEISEQYEICHQIINKIFDYFFPTVAKSTDKNHHKIIANQIQVFIKTIENTLNNII